MTQNTGEAPLPKRALAMKTDIKIEFHYIDENGKTLLPTPAEAANLEALNFHGEEVAQSLQASMRNLATELLFLKRQIYTTKGGQQDAGPDNTAVPSDHGEDS